MLESGFYASWVRRKCDDELAVDGQMVPVVEVITLTEQDCTNLDMFYNFAAINSTCIDPMLCCQSIVECDPL